MTSPAVSERLVEAPVDVVGSVLADPRSYDGIVVGTRRIRWFDARWPEPGTSIHHTIGVGPLVLRDHTDIVRDELPDELELSAGVRPLGMLRVVFRLTPEGDGTRVVMEEGPSAGPVGALWTPVTRAITARRNDVALSRLDDLARSRAAVRALDQGGAAAQPAGVGT